jgi:hypothetical protein
MIVYPKSFIYVAQKLFYFCVNQKEF